jgi:hypothetical protein
VTGADETCILTRTFGVIVALACKRVSMAISQFLAAAEYQGKPQNGPANLLQPNTDGAHAVRFHTLSGPLRTVGNCWSRRCGIPEPAIRRKGGSWFYIHGQAQCFEVRTEFVSRYGLFETASSDASSRAVLTRRRCTRWTLATTARKEGCDGGPAHGRRGLIGVVREAI